MKEFLKKIFGKKENLKSPKTDSNNDENKIINDFKKMNSENRFKKIMILGDTGESQYLPLLKYSIASDPDINVKFAALKRIHLFENSEVENFLIELQDSKHIKTLEPYFSMALSRLGIISIEEFENRMNQQ